MDGCRFEAAQVQSWIFSSFSYFSNILSAVNINILGLYKAFWYTGSAFTKYFNHNNNHNIYTEEGILLSYTPLEGCVYDVELLSLPVFFCIINDVIS